MQVTTILSFKSSLSIVRALYKQVSNELKLAVVGWLPALTRHVVQYFACRSIGPRSPEPPSQENSTGLTSGSCGFHDLYGLSLVLKLPRSLVQFVWTITFSCVDNHMLTLRGGHFNIKFFRIVCWSLLTRKANQTYYVVVCSVAHHKSQQPSPRRLSS